MSWLEKRHEFERRQRVIRAVAARCSAPWHKLLHRQHGGRKRADLAAVITLRHHTLGIPHGMRLKLGAQDVIAPSSSSARNVRSCTAPLRHRWRFLCRVGKRVYYYYSITAGMVVERKPCVRGKRSENAIRRSKATACMVLSTSRTSACRVGAHCGRGMR